MKETIYLCDKCKKAIQKDIYRLYVGIVDPETDDSPECYELNELGDRCFCISCLAEIDKGIIKYISKETKPKKKIDDGMIQALRDAGWTLEAIADELGCCPQTIANRLNAMGKK